jgi:hypothetical protein
MQCFQVTEQVSLGLPLVWGGWPRITTPPNCPQLLFEESSAKLVLELCERLPLKQVRYGVGVTREGRRYAADMHVERTDAHVMFRRVMPKSDKLALVRVETAAGAGGKVFLTANAYDSVMNGGKPPVKRHFHAFPDAGTVPFCNNEEEVARMNAGVEFLDVLIMMYERASFRIFRTGHLEGASPKLSVHWNGRELWMTQPPGHRTRQRAAAPLRVAAEA